MDLFEVSSKAFRFAFCAIAFGACIASTPIEAQSLSAPPYPTGRDVEQFVYNAPGRIGDLPAYVAGAFVAALDKDFYSLQAAGKRSYFSYAVARKFISFDANVMRYSSTRKLWEGIAATSIATTTSADDVLSFYLHRVALGRGVGIWQSAREIFGKEASELTVAEAAFLAAIEKVPFRFLEPASRNDAIAARNRVIDQMLAAGFITSVERNAALDEGLTLR
jgi:hypothetical protein